MRRCARRLVHVHARRRTPVAAPYRVRPSPASARWTCARRSCGCASFWATVDPGKPAISLAVGEPQHGVPSFVGPVLAACLDEFGKYPMNKGLDEFCAAAAGWLGRRFPLPRPVDPATEVLVLNGSREGLFLAGIAAARWAKGRAGRPAILMPNPFYGAYEAGAVAAHAEPVYLPATAKTGFLPDLDSLLRCAARAHRRVLPRLARQPAGLGGEPGLLRAARRARPPSRLHRVQRRVLFRDLHPGTAAQHAGTCRARLRERRRVPVAVEALEPARPAGRLRRRRQEIPRPLPRAAQRVVAAGAGAGAARRHRRL